MRKLGKTNLMINEIGMGGIPIQGVSQEKVNDIVKALIENNINFIDTARGYTVSEKLLGNALVGVREKFVLATKSMSRTFEQMTEDIEVSLKNLKTDYIDLYQMHNVSLGEDYSGALEALLMAKKQGKVKHIGVTTHSIEFLEKIINLKEIETIQFPYNIIENQAEKVFLEAYKKDIGVIVMKPLAGGAIDDGKIALKYILNNPNVSVVIPGMESVEQVMENGSVKSGELTDKEKEIIEKYKFTLGNDFCRRCGYCMPCPVGINIPLLFLCEGYYVRYNLKEWAVSRYNSMKVNPKNCVGCGSCEMACPYHLNIRNKIKEAVKVLEDKNE